MSKVVPEGWKEEILKDLSTVITKGTTPTTYGTGYVQAGIKFIRVENISKDGFIDEINLRFIGPETHSNLKRSQLKAGDLLISIAGAIGRSAIVSNKNLPANTNQAIGIVRLVQNKIDPEFARYSIQSPLVLKQISDSQAGNAQVNLNLEQLGGLRLCCPPLREQQKIATILSSVDNVIEKTRTQIDKLKDLKTGMMQELLTKGIGHTEFKDSPVERIPKAWDVKEFNQIFTFKNGVNKGKESFGHGVPIISYRNVYDGGGIDDAHIENLVEMTDAELPRFKCNYGDVFFTRTSETQHEIGYGNVYLGKRDDVVYSGFVIRARQTNQFLHAEYCKYAFQSHSIRKQMICNSKYTTRAGIGSEGLACLKIGIPPIKEQQKTVNVLQSIDTKIIAANQKLISVEQTKKALMQDLLAGNVRV